MFRHFDEATAADWKPIDEKFVAFQKGIAGQMIAHLQLLATHDLGYPVDRYVHSLQTATRALRDGADDEMVVCALLHDIGDTLAPVNHGPMAAAMLAPYISPLNAWMIEHHEEFQGFFYAEYFGGDKHARDTYRPLRAPRGLPTNGTRRRSIAITTHCRSRHSCPRWSACLRANHGAIIPNQTRVERDEHRTGYCRGLARLCNRPSPGAGRAGR